MAVLLDLVYALLLLACSPWLAWRAWRDGKYRDGWSAKLWGRVPRRLGDRPCLWLHAVSVGEVKLLRPIVADLARRRPHWEVVISTTTATGLGVARRDFPELVTFYAPLDFSWAVRRAMARVRPSVLGLVELELWPNLVAAAHRAGARVAILNARLGERSFRGYRKVRGLLAPTLRQIDLVAAQSGTYASRFVALGVSSGRVRVTGSVKYDGLESERANPRTLALRRALGIAASDVVFVAGSTMEGEEAAALSAYRAARAGHPQLRLVLVPRHPERFEAVARWLAQQGEPVVRRSEAPTGDCAIAGRPVVLVDTVGELSAVWGLADLAFVGGSLYPGRGGQNVMEPAAYAAAVYFGPHTENFRDAVEGLLQCGGARRVISAEDLAGALRDDLSDPEAAAARAAAGRAFVLAQRGASARTVAELERLVGPSGPSGRLPVAC